ncbi:expressed unknown protein [Seminavis robusta]|uniref:Uncharacterized protein n=1 Tax=Seminavis robusta TaxID=568900 RepID=A0A9N8DZG9_9STRA|nr:expressed unknown protein [Seminavis robusta]|eukprot:Sro364_g127120.1 n/a (87) ;mRNA; r:32305-32565
MIQHSNNSPATATILLRRNNFLRRQQFSCDGNKSPATATILLATATILRDGNNSLRRQQFSCDGNKSHRRQQVSYSTDGMQVPIAK